MPVPLIFGPRKNPKHAVHAYGLTDAGGRAFEAARKRLGKLSGFKKVADSDVVEYLARGEDETIRVIAANR